jgi:hypothetical protein
VLSGGVESVGYDPVPRRHILKHEHHFGQHLPMSGEAHTRWVVAMTAATMVVEIAAVETSDPISPDDVKKFDPERLGIAHLTVEVHQSGGRLPSSDTAGEPE